MYDIEQMEKNEDNTALQQLADYLYLKYFHLHLHIPVRFNIYIDDGNTVGSNFHDAAGMTQFDVNGTGKSRILIYAYNAENYNNKMALAIIKHELIHYYLYVRHQRYGHTHLFNQIAHQIGAVPAYVPWSFQSHICKKKFNWYYKYNCPIFYYFYAPNKVSWQFCYIPTGHYHRDDYGRPHQFHYIGFAPPRDIHKVLTHLRFMCHSYMYITMPKLIANLQKYLDDTYFEYKNKYMVSGEKYHKEQIKKHQFLGRVRGFAYTHFNFKHREYSNHKLQLLANRLYKKYFHHKLKCHVFFCGGFQKPVCKFYVNAHGANIKETPQVNDDPWDFDYEDAEKIVKNLKICLVHYYLWATHDPNGYQHPKDFYRIVNQKFHLDLNKKHHPYPFKKDKRGPYFYFYYSCGLGLHWRTNHIPSGAYAYDKNHKLHKAYLLCECSKTCFKMCLFKIHAQLIKYQIQNCTTSQLISLLSIYAKRAEHEASDYFHVYM